MATSSPEALLTTAAELAAASEPISRLRRLRARVSNRQ